MSAWSGQNCQRGHSPRSQGWQARESLKRAEAIRGIIPPVTIHVRGGVVERVAGLLASEWHVSDHDECSVDAAKEAGCEECSSKNATR